VRYFALEKLINLYDGYSKSITIDALHLLLMQHENQVYLIEGRCPHRGHPLNTADLVDTTLRCPLHNYRFSIRTGELLEATEEPCRGLRLYELVYRENELGVMIDG